MTYTTCREPGPTDMLDPRTLQDAACCHRLHCTHGASRVELKIPSTKQSTLCEYTPACTVPNTSLVAPKCPCPTRTCARARRPPGPVAPRPVVLGVRSLPVVTPWRPRPSMHHARCRHASHGSRRRAPVRACFDDSRRRASPTRLDNFALVHLRRDLGPHRRLCPTLIRYSAHTPPPCHGLPTSLVQAGKRGYILVGNWWKLLFLSFF